MYSKRVKLKENAFELCRVCLQQPKTSQLLDLSLIYDEEEQLTYLDCFKILTGIDLFTESANLPRNLCKSCGLELQISYDFYKKIENSKLYFNDVCGAAVLVVAQEIVDDGIDVTEDRPGRMEKCREQLDRAVACDERSETYEGNMAGKKYQEEDGGIHVSDDASGTEAVICLEQFEECDETNEEDAEMEEYQALEELDDDESDWYLGDGSFSETRNFRIEAEENPKSYLPFGRDKIMPIYKNLDHIDGDATKEELQESTFTVESGKWTKERVGQDCEEDSVNLTAKSKKRTRRKRTKIEGPPYFCEYCGHESQTKNLLASHRHRKHRLKENQFKCFKCDKGFDTQRQLERHLKRPTCEPYPELSCEYCSKKIIGLSNYKIHLRFHQKYYPFICHLCGKRFMMTTHLTNHVKTKHENQRYICEHPKCGKMFQTSHSLKAHAYVHTSSMPYECLYCGRMYATRGRLRLHISKSHGMEHTLEDLNIMLVADKLHMKTQMKPVLMKELVSGNTNERQQNKTNKNTPDDPSCNTIAK